jgi:hypothetical protein
MQAGKMGTKRLCTQEKTGSVKVKKLLHLGADLPPNVMHRPNVQSIFDYKLAVWVQALGHQLHNLNLVIMVWVL